MNGSVHIVRIRSRALFPVEMLKMKQRKRGQVPGESVVAGGSRKGRDPCPEDRTTQGRGCVTISTIVNCLEITVCA